MPGVSADAQRLIAILCHEQAVDGDPGADNEQTVEAADHPDFETLLSLYHRKIYNLAYRLLGNKDDAADLTQEAFVKAYKAYPRFRGSSQVVYPWLCRIAVNGCKNKFKEMNRRSRYEVVSLDESVETADSSVGIEIGDESANPAGVLERREIEEKVQESIQALPPEYRVVVVLRDMHGLSYKEIADAAEMTLEIVKSRLFRARALLRRRLEPFILG